MFFIMEMRYAICKYNKRLILGVRIDLRMRNDECVENSVLAKDDCEMKIYFNFITNWIGRCRPLSSAANCFRIKNKIVQLDTM